MDADGAQHDHCSVRERNLVIKIRAYGSEWGEAGQPIEPEENSLGVPFCSQMCTRFDQKRCRILGYAVTPKDICEPAVRELVKLASEWRT